MHPVRLRAGLGMHLRYLCACSERAARPALVAGNEGKSEAKAEAGHDRTDCLSCQTRQIFLTVAHFPEID